jgi:acyl carrier protein
MNAQHLRHLIAEIGLLDESELRDDVSLLDQGVLDSMGLVELQLCIEEELGRELGPDDLDASTFLTINGLADWLNRQPADHAA